MHQGILSISPELIKNLKDGIHWALFEEDQKESFPSTTHQKMVEKQSVPYVCFLIKNITHCVCMIWHGTKGRSGVINNDQEPERLKTD